MAPIVKILLLIVPSITVALVHGQHCPSYEVGHTGTASQSVEELASNRVFINLNDKARCNGTVYGWRVCPLQTDIDEDSDSFEVVLAMYRYYREGNIFIMVDGSYHELSLHREEIDYNCFDYMLYDSEYFDVEVGDRVAACWNDSSNRIELAVSQRNEFLIHFGGYSCCEECIYDSYDDGYDDIGDQALRLSAYINIDECALDVHNCNVNAICADVVGGEDSYNCTCKNGYSGGGFTCVDINSNKETTDNTVDTTSDTEGPSSTGPGTNGGMKATSGGSKDSKGEETGATVGATVAAVIIILLIIAVAIVLVILYLSRQRIEGILTRTTSLGATRGSTKKHANTLTKMEERDETSTTHEYDYITSEPSLLSDLYEQITVNRDGVRPALPDKLYDEIPSTPYAVPIQSKPTSSRVDEVHNSPTNQYEMMQSAPSMGPNLKGVVDFTHSATGDYTSLILQTVQEHIYEALSPYKVPASKQESLYAQLSSYDITTIPREDIQIISEIGTGQFGSVSEAVWTHRREQQSVAVKILADSGNIVKFLQEAAIMAQFRHPNILTLHGVVSVGDPKILVFELMHNGDLKSVVTKMRPNSGQAVKDDVPMLLLNFSKHVALGLHYLACKGFVHRDLAARNILVSSANICKIADFGLSRDLFSSSDEIYVSRGGKIPLKWCAPEAIFHRKYSSASDMWSYGCVLYEIWSLGHKPFETHETKKVPQLLKKCYRLPPPPGCPKVIYKLMIDTWHPHMSSRPQPRDILNALVGKVEEVMAIPPEDVPADSQAAILGAPLDTATHLYPTLQNTYIQIETV